MPDTFPTRDDDADLAWLAQQYVLGDLSSAAIAEFELRLAEDEAAGMALVNAVRLHETILGDEPRSLVPVRQAAWRNLVAIVASLAAAVAIACYLPWAGSGPENGLTSLPPQQAVALVSAWRSAGPEPILTPERWQDEDTTDDEAVPEWLLSAVSLELNAADPVQEN